MEPITTRVAKIYLDEHGFIRVDVNPGAEESYADAKHNMSMMAQAGQGTRRPVIVNMKQMKAIAREARAHYASEEAAKIQKSVALVVSTPVSKVIGNFFLAFNTSKVPMKMFDSEADAVEWSKGFAD